MLEEYKGILPLLLPKPFNPSLQFRLAVIGSSQAQIAPIRSRYPGNLKLVFRLGDTQHGLMVAQQAEDF